MRFSTILGITKTASLTSRFVTLGVIITGLLTFGFGVVTFYGLSTGTYVLSMSEEAVKKGIQLSEDASFIEATSRLYADPSGDSDEATYSYLKIDEARNVNGTFTDPEADYLAYTFYLRNSGNEMVDLVYNINILEVTKNMDDYIRIMVIIDHLDGNIDQTIFMKPDEAGHAPYPVDYPESKLFISESLIANEVIEKLQVGQMKKITIFLWIEGYDTDSNIEKGGGIKLDMKFSILNA